MTGLPSFGLPISYVLEFGPLMLVSTIASLVVIHATCTGYSLPAEYDIVPGTPYLPNTIWWSYTLPDLGAFAYAIVTDCFLGERNVLPQFAKGFHAKSWSAYSVITN